MIGLTCRIRKFGAVNVQGLLWRCQTIERQSELDKAEDQSRSNSYVSACNTHV